MAEQDLLICVDNEVSEPIMRIGQQDNRLRTFLELSDEYFRTFENPMNIFAAFYESQNALMLAVGIVRRNAIAWSKARGLFYENRNSGSCPAGAVAHFHNRGGVPQGRGSERDGFGS